MTAPGAESAKTIPRDFGASDTTGACPREVRFVLRDATAGLHARVDKAFGAFDLATPQGYRRFLSAHARIVPPLERRIRAAGPWRGWVARAPALLQDLDDLGGGHPPEAAFPDLRGAAAWGLQYVLEGSRLGGAVLARRVGEGLPRRYLAAVDGDAWRTFQAELNAAVRFRTDAWTDSAIAGARAAFEAFEGAAALELDDPR